MGKLPTKGSAELAPEVPKRIWNSLEVAKLAVGVSTSLAIFALGMFFTLSSQKQAAEREDRIIADANSRQDKATRESVARELASREQARLDATAAAERANQREATIREQANAFQLAQTNAANQRDDALRRLSEGERRRNRIFELRLRGWESASDELAEANSDLSAIREEIFAALHSPEHRRIPLRVDATRTNGIRLKIVHGTAQLLRYESFFSEDFTRNLYTWRHYALEVLDLIDECGAGPTCLYETVGAFIDFRQVCYRDLILRARAEMGGNRAVIPGSVREASRCF
jgi:hypothetical protein